MRSPVSGSNGAIRESRYFLSKGRITEVFVLFPHFTKMHSYFFVYFSKKTIAKVFLICYNSIRHSLDSV